MDLNWTDSSIFVRITENDVFNNNNSLLLNTIDKLIICFRLKQEIWDLLNDILAICWFFSIDIVFFKFYIS